MGAGSTGDRTRKRIPSSVNFPEILDVEFDKLIVDKRDRIACANVSVFILEITIMMIILTIDKEGNIFQFYSL